MSKLFSGFSNRERASWIIFIVSFIIYSVVSLTKSVYAASIASIVGEGIFTKAEAGTVNAGFYLLYGIGQILGVKIVDKVSPVKFIYITLIGTLICTLGMAFSRSYAAMLTLWSLCGLIQFAIWPAVLRIISEYILPAHRDSAMVYISFSYCVGMLLNYLLASVVLMFARWSVLFIVVSVVVFLCIIMWAWVIKATKKETAEIIEINREFNTHCFNKKSDEKSQSESVGLGKILIRGGVIFLLIPALVRTAMDAGLKSWVPTMIVENYSVSAGLASALTTVLVFVNLGGIFIANFFYPKYVKNAAWGYGLCFLAALPFTVLLLATGKVHVVVVVILLTIVTTLMYAGHQLIDVVIPANFAKFNKAGAVASLINAIAAFGAVFANIGFGFLAEHYGWSATIISWIVLAVIAFVFCTMAVPLWTKFNKGE